MTEEKESRREWKESVLQVGQSWEYESESCDFTLDWLCLLILMT